MTKSILIIETPECCLDCPCSYSYGYKIGTPTDDVCEAMDDRRLTKENMKNEIPNWCPLKPLGKRIGDYGLEVWTSRVGLILQEKGLFERIYKDKDNE